jgi:phosphoribosylanthranilate isomerase
MPAVIQTIKQVTELPEINLRTRVKFCGVTNLEDALHAEALGVDAIGFVFNEASPRCIKPLDAKAIIEQLSAFVTTVGLFVNEDQNKVRRIADDVALNLLQFHGAETPEYCDSIGRPYMKAVRVQTRDDILKAEIDYQTARSLLLDSFNKNIFGGTGEKFNWNLIPKNLTKPFVLAGGLTVSNVKEAILTLRPYAIDVSSGIESAKGIKDQALMSAFIEVDNAR